MEAARVRAQLSRILTSATFTDAGRASSFLRFIVEHALDGRPSEIKESVIAVEVLGRSTSFDSKTDPIVRVEAGRLRDRLREYYDRHGPADDVLISVPKGGYVPEFSERQLPAQLQIPNVLRLSLLPPESAAFDAFVISPDGRRLAFSADVNGRMMLWVRDLDSLEAKLLPGTEIAAFPFWSPDSRSIGFFTPFKLKVIHAAGGPCRDIADVVMGRGGAWNREGIIVFCPRPVGALYQISAAGGTPQAVTSLDAARAEVSHGFPQFLADGRRFLYFAASCRPGESSIRMGSLDSTTSKPLVGAETSAAYAPVFGGRSGVVLYISHESLVAQPLDHQTLELTGEPEIVAPEVRYRRWGQAGVSISSDGLLLYRRGTNDIHQFTWIDRQGMAVSTVGPRNGFASSPHYSFNLSPDERRVAIHRHDDPDTALARIWVMDLFRGGTMWRFTDPGGPEAEFCPVWSPSGAELLFSRGDDRGMRLLRQAISGGSPASIVDTKGPKFPTDWSGDERFITYNSQEPDYRYQHIWVASPIASDQPHPLLQRSHHDGSARFAPMPAGDGPRWIAYTSDETGQHQIYVRSFPDSGRKWQISNEGGFLPQWRRDGRELFYVAPDGTLMAVAVGRDASECGRPQELFVTGLQLHSYSIWMNQYSVANDGQRFLLNRSTEGSPVALTALIPR